MSAALALTLAGVGNFVVSIISAEWAVPLNTLLLIILAIVNYNTTIKAKRMERRQHKTSRDVAEVKEEAKDIKKIVDRRKRDRDM